MVNACGIHKSSTDIDILPCLRKGVLQEALETLRPKLDRRKIRVLENILKRVL